MTRTPPPALEFPSPPCSICGNETGFDSTSFWCTECGITWDDDGHGAQWDNPDEDQCPSTDYYPRLDMTFRCLLAAGHGEGASGPMHNSGARIWLTGTPTPKAAS